MNQTKTHSEATPWWRLAILAALIVASWILAIVLLPRLGTDKSAISRSDAIATHRCITDGPEHRAHLGPAHRHDHSCAHSRHGHSLSNGIGYPMGLLCSHCG